METTAKLKSKKFPNLNGIIKKNILLLALIFYGISLKCQTAEVIEHMAQLVDKGIVYLVSDGKLEAYDATSLEQLWETEVDISSAGRASIHTNEEFIFAMGYNNKDSYNYVTAFNKSNGNIVWKFKNPEQHSELKFVGINKGFILYYGHEKLYGLDIITGKKVLLFDQTGSYSSCDNDYIYVSNYKYGKDKSQHWTTIYDYSGNKISDKIIFGDTVFYSMMYSDHQFWILTSEISGWLRPYIFDKINNTRWEGKFRSQYYLLQGSLIEQGFFWVSKVDKATGNELWRYEVPGSKGNEKGEIIKAVAGNNNTLFLATYNGSIAKLDLNNGNVIWYEKLSKEIVDFSLNGDNLVISLSDNWGNGSTTKSMLYSTHYSLLSQAEYASKQETEAAQKAKEAQNAEIQKRIEYQKKNTYLTINTGGHISLIRKMVISTDGKTIVTAGDDKVIYIRNAQTGEVIDALYGQVGEGSEGKIFAMALSPDNKYLAVAGFFGPPSDFSGKVGAIRLYDFASRKLIALLMEGTQSVSNALAFTGNSKYLLSGNGGLLRAWDVETKKVFKTFKEEHGMPIYAIAADNNIIYTGSHDQTIKEWYLTGPDVSIKTDNSQAQAITSVAVSPDGRTIATGGLNSNLVIYGADLVNPTIIDNGTLAASIAFSPDGKYLLCGSESVPQVSNLYAYNGTNWVKVASYTGFKESATLATAFLNNTTAVCAGGENYEIAVLDLVTDAITKTVSLKEKKRFAGNGRAFYNLAWHNNMVYYSYTSPNTKTMTPEIGAFDLYNKKIISNAIIPIPASLPITSQNSFTLTIDTADGGLIVNQNGNQIQKIIKDQQLEGAEHLSYTFTTKNYMVSGGYRGVMLAYNKEGTIVNRFVGHRDMVNSIVPTPDGKFLISSSSDQTIKIWSTDNIGEATQDVPAPADVSDPAFQVYYQQRNMEDISKEPTVNAWLTIIEDLKELGATEYVEYFEKMYNFFTSRVITPVATLYIGTDNEWILWSDEGYFTSSKYGGKYIGYHLNQGYDKEARFYPFEQFDLKFNRPDIMLDKVGIDDKPLKTAYYLAYVKRLARMGLTEQDLAGDINLPEVVLQSRSMETTAKTTNVEFDATDNFYLLDRVQIYINDVPIFGANGLSVKKLKQQSIHQKITVELTQGKNKIQVSVLNEKGAESSKETYYVTCKYGTPIVKNRYVAVIGVSDYSNNEFDLKYASKDAGDLALQFEKSNGEFASTKVLKILDTEATRENILKVKDFFMQSKVDDQAILFVAGHGLLDEKLDWFFATTDVDFNNPTARGLDYAELEGLLDSIPARNKLMMMDACHSGEVDKEESQLVADNSQAVVGVKSRGFKKVNNTSESLGLQSSFKLMQELFSDISKGSGVVVISSASGAEFAYESAQWNNGVFTYALLEGLRTKGADKNKDGKIKVSELREYTTNRVIQLTAGKQNPTFRKENLEFDFRIQ